MDCQKHASLHLCSLLLHSVFLLYLLFLLIFGCSFSHFFSAKKHELITMLADSEKDMHDWINLLTAVAGTFNCTVGIITSF